MKTSIITVNLNNRDGLQKTIDSVVSQTFHDFEWIVIDGGSRDGSKDIIEQYADHLTYWVSEPDKGIYNAMNKGIKVAKGEYLLFLNSGDFLHDNKVIETFCQSNTNNDIIYGDTIFYKDGGLVESRKYPDELSLFYIYNLSLAHCSTFIRSSLFDNTPYDEKYKIVSDWKFFLQKAIEGCTFSHFSHIVSCFDLSGISSRNSFIVEKEKNDVAREIIPDCILRDLFRLSYFEHLEINNFDTLSHMLRKENIVYRKLTTALLKIFGDNTQIAKKNEV